jgi:hypothetical protein
MTDTLNGDAVDVLTTTFVIASTDTKMLLTGFRSTNLDDGADSLALTRWDARDVDAAHVFMVALSYETDEDARQELTVLLETPGMTWFETKAGEDEGEDEEAVEIEVGERPDLGVFRLEFKPIFTPVPMPTPKED